MLTFFMTPGSCSTGIHILLETLELPFQVTVLNLPAGDHRQPAYLALNPKGSIPALQLDDGRVLTEFGAIAYWLARRSPKAQLLPEDPAAAAELLARLDYAVGTVHGQGWTRVFTPDNYLPPGLDAADSPLDRGHPGPGPRDRAGRLCGAGGRRWRQSLARRLNLADAALFYVFFWAEHTGLPLPPHCAAHLAWMRGMPAVRQVLAEEGYRA
jgi:glutathione S-transferase